MKKRSWLPIGLLVLACSGQTQAATVIFEDNFNAEGTPGTSELNYFGLAQWDLSNLGDGGTIDLINTGDYSITCPDGKCLDMDGTTALAGHLQTQTLFNLIPGMYTLRFDISGNQRAQTLDRMEVSLGTLFSETFEKNGGDSFENVVRQIVVGSATSARLGFHHLTSGDQLGMILDNVSLTLENSAQPVPEPSTLLLLASGLVGLVAVRARRPAA